MATKTTKKKAASGAIVKWDEKFANYAKQGQEQLKNIGAGGVSVTFGRGVISVGDKEIKGGKLECIILGYCALNAFFKQSYDPNNTTPPDCYAFSVIADDPEMKPHAQSAEPQSEFCKDCPQNVYGTAKVGKGKACGNNIRLGLITAKDAEDADGIAKAEIAIGKVSPTNLKHWKAYVNALEEDHGRPPWAVVTEIASYNDAKTQIRLEFRMVDVIDDDEMLEALEKRFLKIQDVLQQPYSAAASSEKAEEKTVGKTRKFAGGKKAR